MASMRLPTSSPQAGPFALNRAVPTARAGQQMRLRWLVCCATMSPIRTAPLPAGASLRERGSRCAPPKKEDSTMFCAFHCTTLVCLGIGLCSAGPSDDAIERLSNKGCYFRYESGVGAVEVSFPLNFISKAPNGNDDDMKLLSQITTLRRVLIGHTNISDDGLIHLAKLPELQEFRFGGDKITDEGFKHIARAKNLRRVFIGSPKVTHQGWRHLAALEHLEEIETAHITDAGLEELPQFKALKRVGFHVGSKITDAGMASLAQVKGLEKAWLVKLGISDEGLKSLGGAKALKQLLLADNKVTDAGLPALVLLEKLEFLALGGTGISDDGLPTIAKISSLRQLNLDQTKITDRGLKSLVALKNLESLYINNTSVSDAGFAHLKAMPSLKLVDLSFTKITKTGVEQLQKDMPKCRVMVHSLTFQSN
ncbi:MAG: hypothetical protein EXR98_14130 [Gemmataceae bacterium]|nr:hypothetical protein [Gemmataceae bacterium]